MQTKPKSNSIITHSLVDNVITFKVQDAGAVELDMAEISTAVINHAAVHGMIQRVSDGAAKSRDAITGKPASPGEKLAAMIRIVDHYMTGTTDWNLTREGGSEGGLLFRALCAARSKTDPEKIREFIDELKGSEKTALLNSPTVKPHADEIRAASTKGIDTDKLLKGL